MRSKQAKRNRGNRGGPPWVPGEYTRAASPAPVTTPSEHHPSPSPDPANWWFDAFPQIPYQQSPPAQTQMLIVVAYDITNPKRLAKVANVCKNFGTRVQHSLFECHLEATAFDDLWLQLLDLIDESEDRVVAYKMDARNAQETETAGVMVRSGKALCYLV